MEHAGAAVLPYVHRVFAEQPWALLAWPAVLMVVGTVLRYGLGQGSQRLAVVPRTKGGLVGLVTAPFLHANFAHLLANLPPFVVLGALVLRKGSHGFVETAAIVTVGSGALVWLFARRGAHMGASGVVFGFFGYLMALGYFTRSTADLLVAGLVLLVYGGILVGLAPARRETSWEAHVLGLLVGIAKVWWLRR
jgi:membrane associated rhomboid family serine protease